MSIDLERVFGDKSELLLHEVLILQERRLHLVMTEDPWWAIIVKCKLYCTFQACVVCSIEGMLPSLLDDFDSF